MVELTCSRCNQRYLVSGVKYRGKWIYGECTCKDLEIRKIVDKLESIVRGSYG